MRVTGVSDAGILRLSAYSETVSIASMATGYDHTIALKSDGSLLAWGGNLVGQLGDGATASKLTPVRIGTENDWAEVGAGRYRTVARKTDGSLWAWGDNYFGQLGDGTTINRSTPVRIGIDNDWAKVATPISQVSHHTVALKTDGSLWAWGRNSYGELGDGTQVSRLTPVRIGTDNNWAEIAVSEGRTVARKIDGSLWAWGPGYLGNGTNAQALSPVQVGTDSNWVAIAVGAGGHTLARKADGSLWAWGPNFCGQIGDGTISTKLSPVRIGPDNDWTAIFAGYSHSFALKVDGSLWAWGSNNNGQLGDGTMLNDQHSPIRVGTDNDWVDLVANGGDTDVCDGWTLGRKSDGSLWGWGKNSSGQFGDGTSTGQYGPLSIKIDPVQVSTKKDWVQVDTGWYSFTTVALKTDGSLWAWGNDQEGQLGDGTYVTRLTPIRVGAENDWAQVAAGSYHTMARKNDGSLWGWGNNSNGQMGGGIVGNNLSPVRIGTENDWAQVAAWADHTMARKNSGTLWGWGHNAHGQVGNGTTADQLSPAQIGTENDWTEVSAGSTHTVARKTDGSVWAWGWNGYGQVGDGSAVDRFLPVRVGAGNDWIEVVAGYARTVARRSNGSIWTWGASNLGGTFIPHRYIPVQIGTSNDWARVGGRGFDAFARKPDGTLWRLDIERLNPVQIGLARDWVAAAATDSLTVALKTDGSLWAWGSNYYGELGVFISGPIGGTYDWGLPTGAPAPIAPARSPAIVTALGSGDLPSSNQTPASPTGSGADHRVSLSALARGGGGAQFQFATEAGRHYRLEGTADLLSGQWEMLLEDIPGTGGVLQVTDPNSKAMRQYFYRVILLP